MINVNEYLNKEVTEMTKRGYRRLRVIWTQDKLEVFDFIRDRYSDKKRGYTIKIIDDKNRSSILWLKETKMSEIKLICRNCGITLRDEFTLL